MYKLLIKILATIVLVIPTIGFLVGLTYGILKQTIKFGASLIL